MKPSFQRWIIGLMGLCLGLLMGCSPTYDWRTVSNDEQGWQVLFPGKPVMAERTLAIRIGEKDQAVHLMLRSVRIDEQTFTIGVARFQNPSDNPGLQKLAEALKASRIQNIQGQRTGQNSDQPSTPSTAKSPSPSQGGLAELVTAEGLIQLQAKSAPVPAQLQMLTRAHRLLVIEAIVAGPRNGFNQEAAQQFLESLRIEP